MQNLQLGLIDNWLRHVQDVMHNHEALLLQINDPNARLNKLCELNVIEQVLKRKPHNGHAERVGAGTGAGSARLDLRDRRRLAAGPGTSAFLIKMNWKQSTKRHSLLLFDPTSQRKRA